MSWDTVQQVFRIAAGWLGAMLIARGYLIESNLEIFVGGFLNLAQIVWWAFWNKIRSD